MYIYSLETNDKSGCESASKWFKHEPEEVTELDSVRFFKSVPY